MFRRLMLPILIAVGLALFVLTVVSNTVETHLQGKRLAEIQQYLGAHEQAIDDLKGSLAKGNASADRAVELLNDVRNRLRR
jgi:hypothetical protein